jgi:hypothetical protein
MATEKPDYKILKKEATIELREYTGYICASLDVTASSNNNAGNNAFSVLADYIFGNNRDTSNIKMTVPVITQQYKTSKKIPMTAPVITTQTDTNMYEVSFILPSEYTMKTVPKPVNPLIRLHQVTKHRAVAIVFSGRSGEDIIRTNTLVLNNWIKDNKLIQNGRPLLARYDPPWKPGFMRKNEVIINVK